MINCGENVYSGFDTNLYRDLSLSCGFFFFFFCFFFFFLKDLSKLMRSKVLINFGRTFSVQAQNLECFTVFCLDGILTFVDY